MTELLTSIALAAMLLATPALAEKPMPTGTFVSEGGHIVGIQPTEDGLFRLTGLGVDIPPLSVAHGGGNCFTAAYVAPELVSVNAGEICFDDELNLVVGQDTYMSVSAPETSIRPRPRPEVFPVGCYSVAAAQTQTEVDMVRVCFNTGATPPPARPLWFSRLCPQMGREGDGILTEATDDLVVAFEVADRDGLCLAPVNGGWQVYPG